MYRQTTTALALALAVASLSTSACLAERGDACAVDSDCAQGFACSPDNICVDFAGLLASFTLNKPTPPKDTTVTPEVVADVASDSDGGPTCRAPRGIFDATPGGPCLEPDEKLKVTRICIAPSGHGTQGLAFVGNAILSDQFDNDTVIVEAWIDGDLTPGCPVNIRWIRAPTDRQADCTVVHGDTLPIEVVAIIELFVLEPKFNPTTGVMTGLVDEDAVLAAIDPAIKATADAFIEKDVDTDGDSVPDKASVIVTIQFGPGVPTDCPTE
jgi:hypothetical protein